MRRLKRIATIVAAIILAAIAYRVLGVYEFRSGECSARKPRTFVESYPKSLAVMSFNIEGHASFIRGRDHIEDIAEVIRKYKPDIVGINEAHRNTWQVRFGDLLEAVVRVNGGVVEFFVTHTSAWASLGKETRDLQLQCVTDHLNASAHPFILTGDLNAPPESEELARFLQSIAMQVAGDPKVPTHRVLEQRLDYILADRGWTVRNARVLDDGPSDHRPVYAELVRP
jgi:endonuclease/exonuclease/phosphatase family metal-dependent hydrolase